MDKRLLTIIKKELMRVFTDRRLVFSSIILPALSIYIIYSFMGQTISKTQDEASNHIIKMLVYNPTNEFLMLEKESNRTEIDITDNVQSESLVLNGQYDVFVAFENDFDFSIKNYEKNQIPQILVYYNPTNEDSMIGKNYLDYEALPKYETSLIGTRLGNISYANAFDINRDITGIVVEQKKITGKNLSNLFPLLIAILLFAGAMGIGLDSIAGEKERGTMSSILMTPVSRNTIAFGKLISLAIIAIISALSNFVGIILSLPNSGAMFAQGQSQGISLDTLSFSFIDYFYLITTMIVLVGIYVGIVIAVSVISKSVKEAGTYISPIYMIIMLIGFISSFKTSDVSMYEYMTPVYGNILIIKDIFSFDLTLNNFILNTGTSLITILLLVFIVQKLFNNENIMS
jgi:sodium transport system permease protein